MFNPVAIAAALLTQENALLFIDAVKLGEDVRQVERGRGAGLLRLSVPVFYLLSVSTRFLGQATAAFEEPALDLVEAVRGKYSCA